VAATQPRNGRHISAGRSHVVAIEGWTTHFESDVPLGPGATVFSARKTTQQTGPKGTEARVKLHLPDRPKPSVAITIASVVMQDGYHKKGAAIVQTYMI
jgi:hypothetical protein